MDRIEKAIKDISSAPATKDELRKMLTFIDLTSLEGKDNEQTISVLCTKAKRIHCAAVCVYPTLATSAKKFLSGTNIKVASVAGAFPSGQAPLDIRLKEVEFALKEGAEEIDMVMSRGKFLEGNYSAVSEEISAFRKICDRITLKIILETGELVSNENIQKASTIAIDSGVDFIKTSTGKIPAGATVEAVASMLLAIKASGAKTGIKPSGGISNAENAVKYLRLTENILGKEWLTPSRFRIGASSLADALSLQLADEKKKVG